MTSRSSSWSVVLAFASPTAALPAGVDPRAWARAGALDTLESLCAAVDPRGVTVLTEDDVVQATALEAGAGASAPGRDVNVAMTAAAQAWARSAPTRSAAIVLGPLPYASPATISAALRSCAAAESALVGATDGGTVLLSHHDPSRLAPRFGGRSAARHQRVAVQVGAHLASDLVRELVPGRSPAGPRCAALLRRADTDGLATSASRPVPSDLPAPGRQE